MKHHYLFVAANDVSWCSPKSPFHHNIETNTRIKWIDTVNTSDGTPIFLTFHSSMIDYQETNKNLNNEKSCV